MPGWHEATKELQAQGKVGMLGIVEEQHPDRARLFMQWKEMTWPVLVDSFDLLEVPYVPITLLIDEHGIVRHQFRPGRVPKDLEKLLAESFEAPAESQKPSGPLDHSIATYQRALENDPQNGFVHFRLGVAFRKRHDSSARKPDDFQAAVDHWTEALRIDPNNYIWRRRIQQYGPRLDKPYPFYDWVESARAAIVGRGQKPVELAVEPRGAELAHRVESFEPDTSHPREPDSAGKIHLDDGRYVRSETTIVPPVIAPGESARVHIELRPRARAKSHWNNEVDDLVVWVRPPPGLSVDSRRRTVKNPPEKVSSETRTVELEVHASPDASVGRMRVPAYALYYVCEDLDGVCMYRRQNLGVAIEIGHRATRDP